MKTILLLAAVIGSTGPQPAAAVVEQPMLEAEYSSQCGSRDLAIYASGFAHLTVTNFCGTSSKGFPLTTLRSVSPESITTLQHLVTSANFASISTELGPRMATIDGPMFSVTVRGNNSLHRVVAVDLDRMKDNDEASRFQLIWQALERLVPDFK